MLNKIWKIASNFCAYRGYVAMWEGEDRKSRWWLNAARKLKPTEA